MGVLAHCTVPLFILKSLTLSKHLTCSAIKESRYTYIRGMGIQSPNLEFCETMYANYKESRCY